MHVFSLFRKPSPLLKSCNCEVQTHSEQAVVKQQWLDMLQAQAERQTQVLEAATLIAPSPTFAGMLMD